jgi:hypothetical protein
MRQLIAEFRRLGFTLHRFPSSELAGPLVPFAPTPEVGNVFALSPGFPRLPAYLTPFEPRAPFNHLFATPNDPGRRAETTALLIAAHSSDGARWANPAELKDDALETRAAAAARLVDPCSRVLDLGAGLTALARHLPAGCSYTPADLLQRAGNCQVVDLNQEQFPSGDYDVVTLLDVFEFIHDVPALLGRCRQAAGRLVCTYRPGGNEALDARRQQGWFNDFTAMEFADLLQAAGWTTETCQAVGDRMFYSCRKA